MPSAAGLIVLDTIGKFHAHGQGLSGRCRACRRHVIVPMPVLIAVRSASVRGSTQSSDCGSRMTKGPAPVGMHVGTARS